jgi:UDP-galactopyranose mutase
MLNSDLIAVWLGAEYRACRERLSPHDVLVYTGPLDEYFDYRYGRLNWRSVRFENDVLPCADYQGTAVMNYADPEVPFTRIHEYRHYRPEVPGPNATFIHREYAGDAGPDADPHYPLRSVEDLARLARYQVVAAQQEPHVLLRGRLGRYCYIDMDDAIGEGLACAAQVGEYLK